MERHLLGRRVLGVWCSGKRLREPVPVRRLKSLRGDRFTAAARRAKFLLLEMQSGNTLVIHLGMTGNLLFRGNRVLHDHVVFDLENSPPLVFADTRRFGMILHCTPAELEDNSYLRRLGVEPLSAAFDAEHLRGFCKGRKRPIKSVLLDGQVVAGVGNIYASEALFHAGIRPTIRAGRLSRARLQTLVTQIKAVLRQAIRKGGTTISDYLGSGDGGRFQQQLAVYGRAGEACRACGQLIRSLTQAGRSSFYCPRCQK